MILKSADSPSRIWEKGTVMVPNAPICNCPIATSLGVLGKKWTLLVLRDIAMRDMGRYSQLMKGIPGITPRMLSARLKELEKHGMIVKTAYRKSAKAVRWRPTDKGWDALPILFSYTAFGSKWFASTVFEDGKPRELSQVYPQRNLRDLYVNLDVDRVRIKRLQSASPASKTSWPT
ncbi:MAG TPA: helix-turn-helix domain-containing protein [Candidatus Angelobacter sp.]|nr:helix-turn-helix domain-containing protein [Candidatus Angelobacter sp.]